VQLCRRLVVCAQEDGALWREDERVEDGVWLEIEDNRGMSPFIYLLSKRWVEERIWCGVVVVAQL